MQILEFSIHHSLWDGGKGNEFFIVDLMNILENSPGLLTLNSISGILILPTGR
jgi:hypothetical protein